MSKLTTKERDKLPTKDFALPNERYPIHDEAHARNALARVSQFGDERERTIVRAKVKNKFPNIHQG